MFSFFNLHFHVTAEAQREFREVQSISIILRFLTDAISPSLQQSSARVIASICNNNGKNTQIVIQENGLHTLVHLLQSNDAAVLDCTLAAIATILEENSE